MKKLQEMGHEVSMVTTDVSPYIINLKNNNKIKFENGIIKTIKYYLKKIENVF